MVKYNPRLDATFGALADPTRRAILTRLARAAASVSELAEPFDMSLPAVSKHLRVLERAGLLTRAKDGRVHRCWLTAGPMKDAADWIARYRRFWEAQFDALERFLHTTTTEEDQRWPARRPAWGRRRSTSGEPSPRRERRCSAPGRTPKR